jgi:uncharacterized protein (TIGR03437 family)
MLNLQRALVPFLLAASGGVFAQKPVIKPNGVVNGASYARSVKGEALLVGGAIFSIFGENLAVSEQRASGTPLPTTLGGTSISVGGIAAPLFYVSPGQINFQVPYAIGPVCSGASCPGGRVGERIPVVVTTGVGVSDPVLAFVQANSPGIFSQVGDGCGPGVIQNVAADGSVTLNTPSNSASPGNFITIYGTGLGPPYSPPNDGWLASVYPSTGFTLPGVFLGIQGFQLSPGATPLSPGVMPWWAGLTPGLVGVNQVNVLLGGDVLEGCAVPLQLANIWGQSAPVTISIRKGGGPCQDAPPASFANLAWSKAITTSPESPSGVAEATFAASFASAPENLAVPYPDPPDPPFGGYSCGGLGIKESSQCKNTGLRVLDAGGLSLGGVPGGPLTLLPSHSGDANEYSTPLPPGSLEGGTLRVTGAGGANVGGFETDVTVPPPIQIITPLAPGTVIDIHQPFSVAWSGGNLDTLVRMRLIAYQDQEGIFGHRCDCPVVLADSGMAKLGLGQNLNGEVLLQIFQRSENAEVVVTVTPLTSKLTRFTAPGLTRGGRHEWSYEYHFKGLKIR